MNTIAIKEWLSATDYTLTQETYIKGNRQLKIWTGKSYRFRSKIISGKRWAIYHRPSGRTIARGKTPAICFALFKKVL
jgi:hypothetical protein